MGVKELNCFFNPKTIAVIGASEREFSLGARILSNLRDAHNCSVFPVNPFRHTVQGIAAYPNVDKISSKVDLAIIATPAHTVPQIIEECGGAGVKGAIIVSAGFDGPTGQKYISQICECQRSYGIRIIGPNSYGVIRPKNNFYAIFGGKRAIDGKIAFISQSAALCSTVLDWSKENQVGLSAVISVGSSIDVKVSELVEYLGSDAHTRAIMIYVESFINIRDFMSAARGYARAKPIIIVKAGRFHDNRDFANLSLGKVVTEDDIYDSVFRRIGIVRVNTINELFDTAKALSMQNNPNYPTLTVITNASGPGMLAADQLELKGGKLSEISAPSAYALKSTLPYYCTVANPIDILEEATPERYRNVMQICLNNSASGGVLVIYSPQGFMPPSVLVDMIFELSRDSRKTLLVALMGDDNICQEARRMLNEKGIPSFRTPEEAVSAFMNMFIYTRNLEALYQTPQEIELSSCNTSHLKAVIRQAYGEGREFLSIIEAFEFLKKYKIPTTKTYLAKTIAEVLSIVHETGYPFTIRPFYSPSKLPNKAELTPVEVFSQDQLSMLFNEIANKIMVSNDFVEFPGVAIQPKIHNGGHRFFIGMKKHCNFGSLILLDMATVCGQNGNVSVGFPPLDQNLARYMLESAVSQRSGEIDSAINSAFEQILVRFSQLIIDFPELLNVDLNLMAYDKKIFAVNASISIDRTKVMREAADHSEDLVIAPYPKKFITQRTLRNNVEVTFRPIRSEDEPRFNSLFKSLSEESVRFRFFEIIKEMSHDTLSRNCNLDYDREIAIVAETQDGSLIGVIRLILDSDRKNGEFAVMVADAWHGIGLGSKLMDYIIDIARELKLESVYSLVSAENYRMIRLCNKMGFEAKQVDDCTVEMHLAIKP